MSPNIMLPRFFPQDSIKLGRFLTDIDNPHHNYHDPLWNSPTRAINSPISSYTAVHNTSASSGFKSTLTSLISAGLSKHSKTELSITTDSASTLTLDNTQGWFKEAMHLPSTRSWIEQRIDEGDNIYMIVGFTCINNAYISYEACRETATEGQGQLPIAAALAATGAVVPLVGDILDPSIGASLQALDGAQSKFLVPGEQVCALQICKISHSWFSSKRVDTSRLSKPWWSSVERWRDEDDGEDDIIEVELSQVEDLDEKWAKVVSGDEVFFRPLFEEP